MSQQVKPMVFIIAHSRTDRIKSWLTSLAVSDERILELQRDNDNHPVEGVISLAGKRCYNSFEPGLNKNVTKTRSDFDDYVANILKSGHGSVLEHATVSFAIENVSRVFTAEMNRHRAGMAISEASLRYIRFDNIKWWMPDSLQPAPNDTVEVVKKKQKTRLLFEEAFAEAEERYRQLEFLWRDELNGDFTAKKKLTSMFRRTIPMGCAVGGVWTGNLRAWRHIIALRTSEHAEEEIRLVMGQVAEQLKELCPSVFSDAFKRCDGLWEFENEKI